MDRLEQISNGFIQAKILLAAAELRVFDLLKDGGATAAGVCRSLDGDLRGVEILLDALTAMEIVVKEGETYRNHPEHEPFLLEDSATQYVSMLRHRNHMFRRWADLEDRVLGLPQVESAEDRSVLLDTRANENFIRAMYAVGHRAAPSTVDRIPLDGVRTVADLGGGPGHYLVELLRRIPEGEGYLADLPLTLDVARELLSSSPLRDRITFLEWDLYTGEAPEELPPLDLAFLSQVIHSESPARNRHLFRRLCGVLAPGGLLVVRENLVEEGRTSPPKAALFAVNMLAMTHEGRTYTEGEVVGWGVEAGLVHAGGERLDERTCLTFLRRPA
jgi:SAM-dependent methyltransferase